MRKNINGILLLDKPVGYTSNQALQRIKHLFQAKKAGHTGSLDPIATGMLPICFGEATKFSQFLLDSDKIYRVKAKLGVKTTTGDIEGSVISTRSADHVISENIQSIIARMHGDQQQIPPMFSAIKHKGKPLYELARQGIEIERKPRFIHIFALKLESLEKDEMTLYIHCSKGTYVRTLVEDIGEELNCGAHVIALRRLTVSPYSQEGMHTLDALEAMKEDLGVDALQETLLPVQSAVSVYPEVTLSSSSAFYLRTGQAVRTALPHGAAFVRLVSEGGQFIGIGEALPDGRVKPHRMFTTPSYAVS
jgi:tRNA pseudouridine55 synthase